MREISTDDILVFERLLKLKNNYDQITLFKSYEKLVKYYHPYFKRVSKEQFKEILLAYEVLTIYRKSKHIHGDKFVREWNYSKKTQAEKKINHLQSLSFKDFMSQVKYNTPGFIVFKWILNIVIFSIVFLMVGVFLFEVFSGAVTIFGIFIMSLLLLGLVIRVFKKGGTSLFPGDFRRFKY